MAACEHVGEGVGEEDPGSDPETEPGDRHEPQPSARDSRANPRPLPTWDDDDRAKPLGLVITAALLFVLVAAAVLFGGHGTMGPTVRPAISGPDKKPLGDYLYGAQEAALCASAVFDDATGSVAGFLAQHCPSRDGGEASHPHY
jgi:hypothetical protein